MQEFNWKVRIYYEDTDAGGIVYYANYLKYMERARTEWLRSFGIEQDNLLEQSLAFVVKKVEMEHHQPAKFNDLLSISSQIVELKRASLVFQQKIYNQNNGLLVSARIKVACVDINIMKPQAIPKFILGELSSVI